MCKENIRAYSIYVVFMAIILAMALSSCSSPQQPTAASPTASADIAGSIRETTEGWQALVEKAVFVGAETGKLCAQAFSTSKEIDECIDGRLGAVGFTRR